jgi:hypothetical protein
MKRLVFAVGVLVFGFVASTPARADFSVMRFEPGYCRIWWNNGINPIGTGWDSRRDGGGLYKRLGRARRRSEEGQVQVTSTNNSSAQLASTSFH